MNDPRYYDKMKTMVAKMIRMNTGLLWTGLPRSSRLIASSCSPSFVTWRKKTHGEEEEDGMMKMVKMEGDERDILFGYWERFILLVTSWGNHGIKLMKVMKLTLLGTPNSFGADIYKKNVFFFILVKVKKMNNWFSNQWLVLSSNQWKRWKWH